MKTPFFLSLSIVFLVFISCNKSPKIVKEPVSPFHSDSVTNNIQNDNEGNAVDYDKTKVIKTLYVIDRKGTDIKDKANEKSKTLGRYVYGTKLAIIEEGEKWYGVLDRISRKYEEKGSQIESTQWEKIYVLKSKTGSISEIALIPSDLNIILSSNENQITGNNEDEALLQSHLTLELIDKSLFDSKKNSAVYFLLADTTVIKKVKGSIELKCQNKVVKYIDEPDAEENRQEFEYKGQVNFLNQYLIYCSYYESHDYQFIDKTTGKVTMTFGEFPFIAPDQNNIICIYANPYESSADLELYSIKDNQIKLILNVSFKRWMPMSEPSQMFWSTDGYLYVAVNHIQSFWNEDGNLNSKGQYIRIKII